MRYILFAIITCGFIAPAAATQTAVTAQVSESRNTDIAREIVEIIFSDGDGAEYFASIISATVNDRVAPLIAGVRDDGDRAVLEERMPGIVDRITPIVKANFARTRDAMVIAYSDTFDGSDLEAILAFAKTPEGHNYFRESSKVGNHPALVEAYTHIQNEVRSSLDLELSEMAGILKERRKMRSSSDS